MIRPRIVLDTNVLLSAIGWEGIPGKLFDFCVKGGAILITSTVLIDEFKKVVFRKKFNFIDTERKEDFFSLFTETAEITLPQTTLNLIPDDTSDNRVLECAVSGRADYIISGDKHLLSLNPFNGISILTPSHYYQSNVKSPS